VSYPSTVAWELSPAHDEWCAERKESVAKALENFGASWSGAFPDKAVITNVAAPKMHPAFLPNYITIGRHGIRHTIAAERMPDVGVTWVAGWHYDVYFVPQISGNTDGVPASEWSLIAYVPTPEQLIILDLGCQHPTPTVVKRAGQYTRYRCDVCEYTYGVDTSD